MFRYDSLEVTSNGVKYNDIEARHIVFAEGFGMHLILFDNLPLDGTKRAFIIKAEEVKLRCNC
jgi:hypothetical protein